MQGYRVVTVVAVMAVGPPIALLQVQFNVATGQPFALDVNKGITEVGPGRGAGTPRVDDPELAPMLCPQQPCPDRTFPPQSRQGLLRETGKLRRTLRLPIPFFHTGSIHANVYISSQ